MKDYISIERAEKLHPKFKNEFISFIDECEKETGLIFRIVQGLRTIVQQDEIYAQGRILPGHIVTRAKGGQSFHNYGLAIDIVPIKDGIINWDYNFQKISDIGWDMFKLTWGGHWKDYDHFENNLGHGSTGWKYFLDLHNAGKVDDNGYVIID